MTTREYLLTFTENNPLLRKLMNSDEIKEANKLVQEGKMVKGISDDKQKTRTYYTK